MKKLSEYPRFKEFEQRPILAIDFGLKVTGLSLYCPGRDPYPLLYKNLIYTSESKLIEELLEIEEQECIEVMVFGVPYRLNGSASEMTNLVQSFIQKLKKSNPKSQIFEQDETLSSKKAEEMMQNSPEYNFKVDIKKIDMLSASIILTDFICHIN